MSVRVLMYSSTSRLNPGGVHAVYTRLAESLRRQGHSVTEAWSTSDSGSRGEVVYQLPRLATRDGAITPRSLGRVLRSFFLLAAGLVRHRPDIVNIHFVRHDGIYFLLLRPCFRYKVVLSTHGSDLMAPASGNSTVLSRLLPRADAITVVNRHLAEKARCYPGVDSRKIHVIPNGVDVDFWANAATSPGRESRPLVLSVGRLARIKGHDLLITAFARLRERVPDARLVIVGDGDCRHELEQHAAREGVEAATTFTGTVGATEVRDLLHQAHVFALPSRSEGTPLALLQAMAAGIPTVATRVGGVPELIDNGSGILVPAEDPAALCNGLASVLEDDEHASMLGRHAQRRVRAFNSGMLDKAYARLFSDLAACGRSH